MQSGMISGNTYSYSDSYSGGVVYVYGSGTFNMQGGTISGNTSTSGGGVYVNGAFNMSGGTISGNTSNGNGGGVYVIGTFTMYGGTISDNKSNTNGGGVLVNGNGRFDMQNGTITGNTAKNNGGGVCIGGHLIGNGTFSMSGGTISGNTCSDSGGGVYSEGTFTMKSGTIFSNTANKNGGGVCGGSFIMQSGTISGNEARNNGGGVYTGYSFTKTGGTIYGSDETDAKLRNIATKGGSALYNNSSQWRNATAGPSANPTTFGFWLNDDNVIAAAVFPPEFIGTWKRDNYNNTLTLTGNTLKSSSQEYYWNLQSAAGDGFTLKSSRRDSTIGPITFRVKSDNLEVSGDSGSGQDNWNGVWRKQ